MADADARAEGRTELQDPKALVPLARHIRWAFGGYILLSAASLVTGGATFGFLYGLMTGSIAFGDEAVRIGTMIDRAAMGVMVSYFIAFLWCVIITCRWTYRAMKNLQRTGRDDTISPGWAVGWYFIPFANLWMPFKAMQEIWHGSHSAESDARGKIPSAMGWWWALWVFGGVLSNIALRVAGGVEGDASIERMVWGAGIDIVSGIMLMISAYLLLGVISRISKAQDEDGLGPLRQIFA